MDDSVEGHSVKHSSDLWFFTSGPQFVQFNHSPAHCSNTKTPLVHLVFIKLPCPVTFTGNPSKCLKSEMDQNVACVLTVAAAVPGAAHGVPVAALLPPAARAAARRRLLRAVAVAAHTALLVVTAWIHLLRQGRQDTTGYLT